MRIAEDERRAPERSRCVRCTGEDTPLSEPWEQVLPAPAWVYFTDPPQRRSLYLICEQPGLHPSMYRPMAPMTVFGFGRAGTGVQAHLTAVPNRLWIGFAESVEFGQVASAVARAAGVCPEGSPRGAAGRHGSRPDRRPGRRGQR